MAYRIEALTPQTWPGFVALAEKHNGVWGGCWCTWFHRIPGEKGVFRMETDQVGRAGIFQVQPRTLRILVFCTRCAIPIATSFSVAARRLLRRWPCSRRRRHRRHRRNSW